ncbi:unnamed protein product [Urochloa humidicola]
MAKSPKTKPQARAKPPTATSCRRPLPSPAAARRLLRLGPRPQRDPTLSRRRLLVSQQPSLQSTLGTLLVPEIELWAARPVNRASVPLSSSASSRSSASDAATARTSRSPNG